MATKNTNTNQNQTTPLTDSIKAMLSSYTDGQGSPVTLEWARDQDEKTVLVENIPFCQLVEGDKVLLDLPEGGQTISVSNLVAFALYQGWKDSNYKSPNELLSLLAAGAVSKLHFNKKSGGGSVVSKVDLEKQWPELATIDGIEIQKGRLADKDSGIYYLYVHAEIAICMTVLEAAKTVPDLEFVGLSPITGSTKQAIKFKTSRT